MPPRVAGARLVTAAGSPRVPAHALVVASVVSVQCGAALAAGLIPRVGVEGSVGLRLTWAAVVLLAVARPWRRRAVAGRNGGLQPWRSVAALGLALAVMNAAFYWSLTRLPLGVAVTVEFVFPLLYAAAKAHRRGDLWAIALAGGGVWLVAGAAGHHGGVDAWGVCGAALAGMAWVGYIVASVGVGRAFPHLDGLAWAMAAAAVFVTPWSMTNAHRVLADPWVVAPAAGVALLSSVIPYGLEIVALRSLDVHVFGVLLSLEPAVAALAGWVVLGQALSAWQWAGLGAVVVAAVVVSLRRPAEALPAPSGASL